MNAYKVMNMSDDQRERAAGFEHKLGQIIEDMLIAELNDAAADGAGTLAAAGNAIAKAFAQVVGAAITTIMIDKDGNRVEPSDDELQNVAAMGRKAAIDAFTGYLEQVIECSINGGGITIKKEVSHG